VAAWEALPLFRTQLALSDRSLARQRSIRMGHHPEGLARSLEVLGLAEMPSYGATLSSIDVPVTLMAGSRDEKFCEIARRLAADNPRFELLFVEGAGHNLLIEAPGVVASAIERVSHRAEEGALQ
jgi:pimeloyl-ACP methyl ester carboxylesterase